MKHCCNLLLNIFKSCNSNSYSINVVVTINVVTNNIVTITVVTINIVTINVDY